MLQLACWNVNEISSEKLNDVTGNKKYDIFGIVESWTSGESNISLPGYHNITVHATKGK